jgi:hypothetical protein
LECRNAELPPDHCAHKKEALPKQGLLFTPLDR